MEQSISHSKFQKLIPDLKKIIFSYLDTYDLIIIYNLNKKLRLLLPDSGKNFNKNNLKVSCLALSLKNKNSYLKKHHYINYQEDTNIIHLIISYLDRTENLTKNEILLGIANYFKICREKFKEKHIKLDFNRDNILQMVELTRLLDKEKFIYSFFIDSNKMLTNDSIDENLELLLTNIKFIKCDEYDEYDFGKNIYKIEYNEDKMSIQEIKEFLYAPYESKNLELQKCFYSTSHRWDRFNIQENIEILQKINKTLYEIIEFNGSGNNLFENNSKKIDKKILEKFPDGLENLTTL
jgi:hypothetical protein